MPPAPEPPLPPEPPAPPEPPVPPLAELPPVPVPPVPLPPVVPPALALPPAPPCLTSIRRRHRCPSRRRRDRRCCRRDRRKRSCRRRRRDHSNRSQWSRRAASGWRPARRTEGEKADASWVPHRVGVRGASCHKWASVRIAPGSKCFHAHLEHSCSGRATSELANLSYGDLAQRCGRSNHEECHDVQPYLSLVRDRRHLVVARLRAPAVRIQPDRGIGGRRDGWRRWQRRQRRQHRRLQCQWRVGRRGR